MRKAAKRHPKTILVMLLWTTRPAPIYVLAVPFRLIAHRLMGGFSRNDGGCSVTAHRIAWVGQRKLSWLVTSKRVVESIGTCLEWKDVKAARLNNYRAEIWNMNIQLKPSNSD